VTQLRISPDTGSGCFNSVAEASDVEANAGETTVVISKLQVRIRRNNIDGRCRNNITTFLKITSLKLGKSLFG
jgi:hypothetical protein